MAICLRRLKDVRCGWVLIAALSFSACTVFSGTPPKAERDGSTPNPGQDADLVDAGPSCETPMVVGEGTKGEHCEAGAPNTCTPQEVSRFTWDWHPPSGLRQKLCTPPLINAWFGACYGFSNGAYFPVLESQACKAFGATDEEHANCEKCILTGNDSPTYGAIIYHPQVKATTINVMGCVALRDPCTEPCARVAQTAEMCEVASCAAGCLTPGPDAGSYGSCIGGADNCFCREFAEPRNSCINEITNAATEASRACGIAATDAKSLFQNVATTICGY